MQENFKILGLTENATEEEIEKAYQTLKDKYREERFLEGEKGNEAAKKLTQVETAYQEIMSNKKVSSKTESTSCDFSQVEEYLKAGNLSKAQELLDEYNDRNAEWHYLQAVVFYKKNWTNESKKQLEIAMNMEPTNQKYSEAYTKLKARIEFIDKQFKTGNPNYDPNGGNEKQMGGDSCSSALDFCTTLCCVNLMCNCCCR